MENNSPLPPILSKPKLTKKYEPSPCDYQILALIEREQLTVMDVLDAMLPNPTSYLYLRVDLLDKAGLLTRYHAHSNAERVWKKPGEILGTAAREEPGMLRTLSCCSVPAPPLFGSPAILVNREYALAVLSAQKSQRFIISEGTETRSSTHEENPHF
jgi:hypothetical protein